MFHYFLLSLLFSQPVSAKISITKNPDVLWSTSDHSRPFFLPESAFNGIDERTLSKLPLSDRALRILQDELAARSSDSAGTAGCGRPLEGEIYDTPLSGGTLSPRRLTIIDKVKKNQIALLARVERVVSGWLVAPGVVASRVYVATQEIYADAREDLKSGDHVSYMQAAGRLRIGAHTLCTDDLSYKAKVGDQVIVMGWYDESNPGHISTNKLFIYQVVDQVAIPPPSEAAVGEQPVGLAAVRAAARARLDTQP